MARPLRIEYPGALHHVISRGNEQRPIVRDDGDRAKRLEWLRRTVETYGWDLHAFVLMTNHEHLFVETPEPNLSSGMQYLNGSYTSYFNRRWRRSGHLFQGRFKAHIVDSEGYFQVVSRYIHLNPVRARIVPKPNEYPWSSFPGYTRATKALDWITYERVLMDFGPGNRTTQRRRYRRYVEAGIQGSPEYPFDGVVEGLVLGSQGFIDRIRELISQRSDDPAVVEIHRLRVRPSLGDIARVATHQRKASSTQWRQGRRSDDGSRAVIAFVSRRWYGYRCNEIAEMLGYTSVSSISRSVRHVETNIDKYQELLGLLKKRLAPHARKAIH